MNRVRNLFLVAFVAGLTALVPACGSKPTAVKQGDPVVAPGADIGAPLYAKQPMPRLDRLPAGAEPVVVSQAVIQPDERVQIASQVDGTLILYGEQLEAKPAVLDGNVVTHPNYPGKYFRRLRETNPIKKEQVIARIDEQQLFIQKNANRLTLDKTKDAAKASELGMKAADDYYQKMKVAGTAVESLSAFAQLARAQGEYAQTIREQARLEGEYDVAEFKYGNCRIRSSVDGRIVKFLKNPGEFVKAGEAVLEVQSSRQFRVEGKLDVQDANRIKPYTPAEVVPVRPVGPEPFSTQHRREVSAVAVTAHAGRPLVVSGGMDATALVWEPLSAEKAVHVLPHPAGVGVKAVAVTGKDAGTHLAVTGGTDGKLRLWDLNDPASLPRTATEFEEGHGGAVAAIAFSPDGKFLATAAGREVMVWGVGDRKKKYALPGDHRDDVTAVRFTPQATLVTVCRDKSVRVWNVGTDAASLALPLDNRSGTVDVLGVSSDGGRMLFDQDAGRIDVVSLDDGRTVGTLQNGGGTRFATFALFSDDDKYVLTAGGDADTRGEMQLWEFGRAADSRKAAGTRAAERRRLVTPNRVAVTAAAFSPDPAKKFVVVGTAGGGVYFWKPPEANDPYRTLRGKVTAIMPGDSRTSTIRVEVELEGPDDKTAEALQDRGTAAILIDPTDAPEPPKLPASAPSVPKAPMAPLPPLITPTGGVEPKPMK